jgi:hypothetical protein
MRAPSLPANAERAHGEASSCPTRWCAFPVLSSRNALWHDEHVSALRSVARPTCARCRRTLSASPSFGIGIGVISRSKLALPSLRASAMPWHVRHVMPACARRSVGVMSASIAPSSRSDTS